MGGALVVVVVVVVAVLVAPAPLLVLVVVAAPAPQLAPGLLARQLLLLLLLADHALHVALLLLLDQPGPAVDPLHPRPRVLPLQLGPRLLPPVQQLSITISHPRVSNRFEMIIWCCSRQSLII